MGRRRSGVPSSSIEASRTKYAMRTNADAPDAGAGDAAAPLEAPPTALIGVGN